MTVHFSEGELKELNINLQPIPPAPASLEGQVIDADTSSPLGGVLVEIVGLGSVTTASNGTYSIQNIPPGGYTVRFSKEGYQAVEY